MSHNAWSLHYFFRRPTLTSKNIRVYDLFKKFWEINDAREAIYLIREKINPHYRCYSVGLSSGRRLRLFYKRVIYQENSVAMKKQRIHNILLSILIKRNVDNSHIEQWRQVVHSNRANTKNLVHQYCRSWHSPLSNVGNTDVLLIMEDACIYMHYKERVSPPLQAYWCRLWEEKVKGIWCKKSNWRLISEIAAHHQP